jgi:hypothetical protein
MALENGAERRQASEPSAVETRGTLCLPYSVETKI